ncbi:MULTISPECIES: DsbA family protein [unclassified Herbaspirillum]|uniref:DsbA family protein n=1 Tax=unclassified Herbaspirillum TaxID=2624150 RepID=UPI000E2F4659|nr:MULTISPECIES: DsbA family protein [unclassified Herbaspirillum]RFB67476.1 DsbA family protein [Herbaspirillum sp. 3R-3a1]TFI05082.1 DsbA family protein [Herbaspirillum sp. 3R11]TFI12588.1 DsbA family protein [Herbaspirillum sp. 3R-11]TFI28414.1 DsbA family protein [Herbaspirillum sp. 3C11]
MKLVYVGDPMCSWCYGFGKELTELTERHPDLPVEIVVGGLRAGATDVLDDAGKQFRLTHWARVEAASGLPFNREGLMARENFVYDTEPICRAVVAARILAPEADLLAIFRALQHGFYVEAVDTTDGRILSRLATDALALAGHAIDADMFYRVWSKENTIAAAHSDFRRARALGVQSFPTLFLEKDGELMNLSPGYVSVNELDANLRSILQSALH